MNAFRPNGTGFHYVAYVPDGPKQEQYCTEHGGECWILQRYDLDTGAIEDLSTFGHVRITGVSVAPDEKRCLLSVQGASDAVRDLWLYDHESGSERLFLEGATYGVWAPSP